MKKSSIKHLCTIISRSEVARVAVKKGSLKVGVSLRTVSGWCKNGYAPIEYHESLAYCKKNKGRITLDDLYSDLRNKIL